MGKTTPVSLFACIMVTRNVSGSSADEFPQVEVAVAIDAKIGHPIAFAFRARQTSTRPGARRRS